MSPKQPHKPIQKTYEQGMQELAEAIYKKSTNKTAKIIGFMKGADVARASFENKVQELSDINEQIIAENKRLENELTELKSQNK